MKLWKRLFGRTWPTHGAQMIMDPPPENSETPASLAQDLDNTRWLHDWNGGYL